MGKIALIYWSGTGNTAAMAEEIAKGMQSAGAETEVFSVDKFSGDISAYDKIAFGCPAMGDEVLEECEFEPFFAEIESKLSGKKVALFGSYGWGDGKWMNDWQDRVCAKGASLYDDGLTINGLPDAQGKEACQKYGNGFVAF